MVTAEMKPVVGGGEEVTINEGKVEINGNSVLLPVVASPRMIIQSQCSLIARRLGWFCCGRRRAFQRGWRWRP
jgi:hypothetical protein